jgi:phosphopentomutase
VRGFGRALEEFDAWLAGFLPALEPGDLLVITADHGCDPTTPGTDHTRESVPLLVWHSGLKRGGSLGIRRSFADVAATLADMFGVRVETGSSFADQLG